MTPFTKNATLCTATSSLAAAETDTLPLTCELFAGVVMETVGGVVSGGLFIVIVLVCAAAFPVVSRQVTFHW